MCGRPRWRKGWRALAKAGAVMCPAFETRRVWPLALMVSADRRPIMPTRLIAHDDKAGLSRLRIRWFRHHFHCTLAVVRPAGLTAFAGRSGGACRLMTIDAALGEHRPGDPGDLVGERHGGKPRRLLRQQPFQPGAVLRRQPAATAQDRGGADD